MKSIDAKHYVLQVGIDRDKVSAFDDYPYSLPVCRNLTQIDLHPAVTFLIGENGAGKSTLLEAIAVASGFNAEGGSRNFQFSTRATHSSLHEVMTIRRGLTRPKDGFFLRAESFYNVATEVDNLGAAAWYGGKSLHHQSHGESFMALAMDRFHGSGIYLLDEPEAALSPTRQLALLIRIHQLVNSASQFIIATHSPILMAYPNAVIYQITDEAIQEIAYTDTEHYAVTRQFLNNHEGMLSSILEE
ncbi:MAG: AAA family ATPase [Phycisphaera sp.]|nr:AAA family ATPase [Phycisphaera sp.]